MATKDLKKIVDGLETSIDEYNQMSLPSGCTKQEALNVISKEIALVSNIEKREQEKLAQNEELAQKKDHTFFLEGQDKERLKNETEKLAIEKASSEHNMSVQDRELELKTQEQALRQAQFDADQKELKLKHENERRDFLLKVVMFGVTSVTTLLSVCLPVFMYKSLAKMAMRYSWQYDGRTPTEFNEFMRGVKPRV